MARGHGGVRRWGGRHAALVAFRDARASGPRGPGRGCDRVVGRWIDRECPHR
ncbi:hypothetical protein LC55x_2882 [Lysobacter capsici]|nr:hypothetical protein LC55x_2882 [Lysobacter capsici]